MSAKQIYLYNPSKEDFITTYDINGDGHPVIYELPSKEIRAFNPTEAAHVKKHLADMLVNERGFNSRASDLVYAEIYKEIEADI